MHLCTHTNNLRFAITKLTPPVILCIHGRTSFVFVSLSADTCSTGTLSKRHFSVQSFRWKTEYICYAYAHMTRSIIHTLYCSTLSRLLRIFPPHTHYVDAAQSIFTIWLNISVVGYHRYRKCKQQNTTLQTCINLLLTRYAFYTKHWMHYTDRFGRVLHMLNKLLQMICIILIDYL